MSHTNPAARRAYHRAYYHRHAVKRRAERRYHKQAQTWCRWLIRELLTNWPEEPAPLYSSDLLSHLPYRDR